MMQASAASEQVASPLVDWWGAWSRASDILWTRGRGAAAVAEVAKRRAAELVRFARTHSPFYRAAWRHVPAHCIDVQKLPVVCKHELMSRFDAWLTDRSIDLAAVERFLADRSHIGDTFAGRYVVWKSSGSTGEPGIYLQDAFALTTYDALLAVQMQSFDVASRYAWGFVSRGGRAALVAATGDHFASIASWQRVCRGSPWPNARAFSVLEPLPELVRALNAYQPAFLAGYPTTLAMLAAERHAGRLQISPSCVWSGGEYLSPATHAYVARAFGCTLVNEYGASECMSIAYSCARGRLHVNADWVMLEPVDRDLRPTPPGEASHTVLLTNLANRIQPVIRYDLGDSVTLVTCTCGSPLPAIRAEGRRDDVLALRASDGTTIKLSPLALTTVMEEAVPDLRFQLVQVAPSAIDVRLAPCAEAERLAAWHAAEHALRGYLARQSLANAQLHLADESPLPDPRSGKLREVLASSMSSARRH